MPSGVRIQDIVVGTGEEAVRGKTVVVNVRMFLNRGTQLLIGAYAYGPRLVIDLGRRDYISGLRYGIAGMRVGGRRELVISPHLAYGSKGIPGHIPPNAVLRCEVELLEVREPRTWKPDDYAVGKHLYVFHPGEAARNLPRWQFGLDEDGRCGVIVTTPIPGAGWRHARSTHTETHLDATTTQALFAEALHLPQAFPHECLSQSDLWADMTERGNAITRDKSTNTLCLTIGVMERGQWLCYLALPDTSSRLHESRLFQFIGGLLKNRPTS